MGYAGRIFSKHDSWFCFLLGVMLLVLFNSSVVSSIAKLHAPLLGRTSMVCIYTVFLAFVFVSCYLYSNQQYYINRYKVDLKLSRDEKNVLIVIELIFHLLLIYVCWVSFAYFSGTLANILCFYY